MTIIVLEGPDGAGKTTLAENIRAQAGRRYFAMVRHSCRPLSTLDAVRFHEWLDTISPSLDLVVDRHPFISEPIYGPIIRNRDLLENYPRSTLLRRMQGCVKTIVYCRPTIETIRAGIESEPQLQWVKEKIGEITNAYDKVMEEIYIETPIKVIRYDWQTKSVPDLIKELFP